MRAHVIDFVRRKLLPALLWLAVVGGAYLVWRGMGSGMALHGFAEAIPHRLSAVEPARVEAVLVTLGDRVTAGEIVAVLDARAIDAELRATEADKARVAAEITRSELEARASRTDSLRGIAENQATVERSLREAKTRLATAKAELRVVESELARQRKAVSAGLVAAADLAGLEIQHASLSRTVIEEGEAVKLYQQQVEAASQLATAREPSWVEAAVAPLEAELRVLEARARVLEARRDQYILRAPVDGQVSAVHGGVESTVTPGVALVEIVPTKPGRILACLGENVRAPVTVGVHTTVRPYSAEDVELSGRAVSVGPVIELPARCRFDAQIPVWGRLVTVELSSPASVVPGESFVVRFDPDDE